MQGNELREELKKREISVYKKGRRLTNDEMRFQLREGWGEEIVVEARRVQASTPAPQTEKRQGPMGKMGKILGVAVTALGGTTESKTESEHIALELGGDPAADAVEGVENPRLDRFQWRMLAEREEAKVEVEETPILKFFAAATATAVDE